MEFVILFYKGTLDTIKKLFYGCAMAYAIFIKRLYMATLIYQHHRIAMQLGEEQTSILKLRLSNQKVLYHY